MSDSPKASVPNRALQVLAELLHAAAGILILIGAAIVYENLSNPGDTANIRTAGILWLIAGCLGIGAALLRLVDSLRNYFALDYKYGAETFEMISDVFYLAGWILWLIAGCMWTSASRDVQDAATVVFIVGASCLVAAALAEWHSDQYSFNSRWTANTKDVEEARGRLGSVYGSALFTVGTLLLLLGAIVLSSRLQQLENLASILWIVGGSFIIAGALLKLYGALRHY